jgi:hypothetical protein
MARTLTWLTATKTAVLASVVVIAGCAGAIVGKTPSAQFDVPIDVQTAYDRTIAQAKYCLVTKDNFPLTAQISPDRQTANVTVRMSMTGTLLADIKMRAIDAQRTNVLVNMWGVDVWDQTAVDAMKAAIEFGVPSCINYFPTTPPPKRSRR